MNSKKEITLTEWLGVAATVVSNLSVSLKDDGKISLDEALKLMVVVLTQIVNAYNND